MKIFEIGHNSKHKKDKNMKRTITRTKHILVALFAVKVILVTGGAYAATCVWTGNGNDTLWSTPENWDLVPDSTSSLNFRQENPPNKTATINSAISISGNIHMGKGSSATNPYVFESTDPAYGLTIQDDVWLGYNENGWLWIKSGTYVFGVTSDKGMQIGKGSNNFWLKVGDGESTASLTATAKDVKMYASSVLIADKATLNFSGKNFSMHDTSKAYLTNSIMSVSAIQLGMTNGKDNYLEVSGGTVTGKVNIGDGNTSGTSEIKVTGGGKIIGSGVVVGRKGHGRLLVEDGEVDCQGVFKLSYYYGGNSDVIVKSDGVLRANMIQHSTDNGGKGNATLTFDGGTVRANVANKDLITAYTAYPDRFVVTANAGGGTIDTANLSGISISADIGGKGGMTFKGGQAVTLSGAANWTGGTTVEVGTKIIVTTEAEKSAILANLVVDGRMQLETGTYTVLEYSAGELTNDDLSNIKFINCGDGTTVEVADGGTKINVQYIHADFASEWTLELDGDKKLSEADMPRMLTDGIIYVTVTKSVATLTVDKSVASGQIVFTDGTDAKLFIVEGTTLSMNGISGIGDIVNNGTLVKSGEGTVAWPFNNASQGVTVVNSGTLKVASVTGKGKEQTVRVKSGATFDMNGKGTSKENLTATVRLEEDSTLTNTGIFTGNNTAQLIGLVLEGDATVTASTAFGLVAASYNGTIIDLGSHTLTLSLGNSTFWLVNTTITGDGTIAVNSGTLQPVHRASTGANCTIDVGPDGTVRLVHDLTVKNYVNGGTFHNESTGTLTVSGELTPGISQIKKLTLANGATVKATGTAQVVSTTFTATGSYTIDASAIAKAQLKEAADERIPVLTVPTANKGGTWTVVNPPIDGCRYKWIDNEGGTSTLYLCRSSGTMIIVR